MSTIPQHNYGKNVCLVLISSFLLVLMDCCYLIYHHTKITSQITASHLLSLSVRKRRQTNVVFLLRERALASPVLQLLKVPTDVHGVRVGRRSIVVRIQDPRDGADVRIALNLLPDGIHAMLCDGREGDDQFEGTMGFEKGEYGGADLPRWI